MPPPKLLSTSTPTLSSFTSDTLWNYEVGLKSELFDKRLSFDIDAFFIDWRNIQLQPNNVVFATESNGGAASSRGVEYEASYHPF
ncbi:MAG: TonB-dependent receptor [Aliidongia sp.]